MNNNKLSMISSVARRIILNKTSSCRMISHPVHRLAYTTAATAIHDARHDHSANPGSVWSQDLSFTSPESDFTGLQARLITTSTTRTTKDDEEEWSQQLSFASPEANFTAQNVSHKLTANAYDHNYHKLFPRWSGQLSFASPESDFCSSNNSSSENNNLFSNTAAAAAASLPRTLEEVLTQEEENDIALVVTTRRAPHKIVHVNHAWENLCRYTKGEVLGQTLSILQGPRTNVELATATVQQLLTNINNQNKNKSNTEPAIVDMFQVNYKKNKQDFINHITMGPLLLNHEEEEEALQSTCSSVAASPTISPVDVELLVALLEPVEANQVPLRLMHV